MSNFKKAIFVCVLGASLVSALVKESLVKESSLSRDFSLQSRPNKAKETKIQNAKLAESQRNVAVVKHRLSAEEIEIQQLQEKVKALEAQHAGEGERRSKNWTEPINPVMLDFCNAKVTQNNLGGKGPMKANTKDMIKFEGIATVNGQSVDLIVQAPGNYTPFDSSKNGVSGPKDCFGQINVACGTKVDLRFSFRDTATHAEVTIPNFHLTLSDLDEGKLGKCGESATVFGSTQDWLSKGSALTRTWIGHTNRGPALRLETSAKGDAATNPSGNSLTPTQRQASAALFFEKTTDFYINFATRNDGGYKGRNILFTGRTSP